MPPVTFDPNVHVALASPRCPICSASANVYRRLHPPDIFEGSCEVCGDVNITLAAAEYARNQGKAHLLSAALKRRPAGQAYATIKREDVEQILKDSPSFTVLEHIDLVLNTVANLTQRPGDISQFQYTRDYPLVYASSPDEALFYLRSLHQLGYVEMDGPNARLVLRGYERLEQIEKTGKQSNVAFVAMWFDSCRNFVYEDAIEPAIKEAGYQPLRIDKFEHVNRIDDEIIGQIKRSRFMVADFSGQRAGVYFEAGLMLGLNRYVIWMCDKKELRDVHFDTRQYNFIDYESASEAKERLFNRIMALVGEGRLAARNGSQP